MQLKLETICLRKNVMNKFYLVWGVLFILAIKLGTAQENQYIENIIIVFENSEHEKYKKRIGDENIFGEYSFLVPENYEETSSSYRKGLITLVEKKYKDYNAKIADISMVKLKVHKSFLKKNKAQIISIKEMRKIGYNKVFQMLLKAKHIFIIDKNEYESDSIIIKEVQHFYIPEE